MAPGHALLMLLCLVLFQTLWEHWRREREREKKKNLEKTICHRKREGEKRKEQAQEHMIEKKEKNRREKERRAMLPGQGTASHLMGEKKHTVMQQGSGTWRVVLEEKS